MIVQLYKVPAGILSDDNKPSKQLFAEFITASTSNKVDAKTVTQPNLSNIKVQCSSSVTNNDYYNLLFFDGKYYKITNFTYVQSGAIDNTFILEAEVDLYLTYLVSFFDEQSQEEKPVFFLQKHLNRSYKKGVYFSKQSGFLNLHKGINIENYDKEAVFADFNYSSIEDGPNYFDASRSSISQNFFNLQRGKFGNSYSYILIKESVKEMNQPYGTTAYDLFYGVTPYAVDGNPYLQFSGDGFFPPGNDTQASPNNYKFNGSITWFNVLTNLSSDYYLDIITLPAPVHTAYASYTIAGLPPKYGPVATTTLEQYNKAANTSLAMPGAGTPTVPLHTTLGANLFYIKFGKDVGVNNTLPWSSDNNIARPFFDEIAYQEPALMNYVKLRAHYGGEDSEINLVGFDGGKISRGPSVPPIHSLKMLYLFSFSMSLNYPYSQITNIPFEVFQEIGKSFWGQEHTPNFGLVPGNYNKSSDAIFCLNAKYIEHSASNNGKNYLANHSQQYNAAKNVQHFMVQRSQAQVVATAFGVAAQAGDGENAIFDPVGYVANLGRGAANIAAGTFTALAQSRQYNYLTKGKRMDMSRVTNERNSANGNPYALYNTALNGVFEIPVPTELLFLINKYALDGYILNRYDKLRYWNNRKVCNYVKIAYFSDVFLPNLLQSYKTAVDNLLNKGVRIGNKLNASVLKNGIDFSLVQVTNFKRYKNVENNPENDEETEYLIDVI